MRLLTLDRQHVDLITVQQKQLGDYNNLQFDMCGITDRSVTDTLLLIYCEFKVRCHFQH